MTSKWIDMHMKNIHWSSKWTRESFGRERTAEPRPREEYEALQGAEKVGRA